MIFSLGVAAFFETGAATGAATAAATGVGLTADAARRARHFCSDGLSRCQKRNANPSATPLGCQE
jgi:hypothetical protein